MKIELHPLEQELVDRCLSHDPYVQFAQGGLEMALHVIRKLAMALDAQPDPFEKAQERRNYALLQAAAVVFTVQNCYSEDAVRRAEALLAEIEK